MDRRKQLFNQVLNSFVLQINLPFPFSFPHLDYLFNKPVSLFPQFKDKKQQRIKGKKKKKSRRKGSL
jgi:hypothetical protein